LRKYLVLPTIQRWLSLPFTLSFLHILRVSPGHAWRTDFALYGFCIFLCFIPLPLRLVFRSLGTGFLNIGGPPFKMLPLNLYSLTGISPFLLISIPRKAGVIFSGGHEVRHLRSYFLANTIWPLQTLGVRNGVVFPDVIGVERNEGLCL